MTRQIQCFLSAEDEVAFSIALLVVRPRLVFVDGNRWETRAPLLASSIATCTSWWVFLWDQGIVESLPFHTRKDAKFEGSTAGLVV